MQEEPIGTTVYDLSAGPTFTTAYDPNVVLVDFVKRCRPIVGPNAILIATHTLTLFHGLCRTASNRELDAVLHNPFSVKRFGNPRALQMYEDHLYDNPSILFDIAVLCELEGGTILCCSCKHKRCHGEIVVEVARRIYCERRYDEMPHVKVLSTTRKRKVSIFGSIDAVKRSLQRLEEDNPSLVVPEETKVYGPWQYTSVTVVNMFTHLFDTGDNYKNCF